MKPPSNETSIRRIDAQNFSLAEVGVGDTAQVERLFARCFGAPPGPDWHRWKCDTLGGKALGLWNEAGDLVAHYAGFPRSLLWQGKPLAAIQIGDVMVAPEARVSLTPRGAFFQVSTRFVADHVGSDRDFMLAFGFPNERAMRLGVRLKTYDNRGHIQQLAWPARAGKLSLGWRWSPLAADEIAPHVDAAWQAMAADMANHVLGVRDAAYVIGRFVRRPDRQYRFFRLSRRLTGRTAAVAIMRLEPGYAELIDVIGPRQALRWIALAAASEAAVCGAEFLTCWASESAAAAWGEYGAQNKGTAAFFVVDRPSVIPLDKLAAAQWWWMGGDTDFL